MRMVARTVQHVLFALIGVEVIIVIGMVMMVELMLDMMVVKEMMRMRIAIASIRVMLAIVQIIIVDLTSGGGC